MKIIGFDIQEAAGSLQLCAGQHAGCEAAVHSLRNIFSESDTQAVLFVDAANAFNNLNRQVALLNIQCICPPLSTALFNNYRCRTPLYIDGECIWSQEGTTQGDPLAMSMYICYWHSSFNPLSPGFGETGVVCR